MNEEIIDQDTPETPIAQEQPSPDDDTADDIEEPSEEDSPDGEQPDDEEDVDIDGEKYRVPKKLKDAFMRTADYTQKAQSLAEQKAEYEAQRETFAKVQADQAQFLEDVAEVRAMDKGLKEFADIDWNRLAQTDPNRALQLQIQYQQLREARGAKATELDTKVSQHVTESAKREAAETEKTIAALKAPDPATGWPGFSDAHMAKLAKSAGELGISKADLNRIKSPVAIKILNLAVLGQQSLKAAKKAITPNPNAQPVTQIRGNRAVAAKSPDKMSTEEWVKMERARMARKAAANR